jgi:hypothetical protein
MQSNYIIEMHPFDNILASPNLHYDYPSQYCFQQHQFILIGVMYIFMLIVLVFSIFKNLNLHKENHYLENHHKVDINEIKRLKEIILENEENIIKLEEDIDEFKDLEKSNIKLTKTLQSFLSRKRPRVEYEKPTNSYNLRLTAKKPTHSYYLRSRKNKMEVSYKEESSESEEYESEESEDSEEYDSEAELEAELEAEMNEDSDEDSSSETSND